MKKASGYFAGLVILLAAHLPAPAEAQDAIDGVTGFPRQPLHVAAWPGGKKIAVSSAASWQLPNSTDIGPGKLMYR